MSTVTAYEASLSPGDIIENYADFYALCFSRPTKFKLINLGQHMSPIEHGDNTRY